ncbi:MAG TPA: class I SAM-dependent methyltransferase [Aldersonia sp.]
MSRARPSPNIWNWPGIYEAENRAHDVDDAIATTLRPLAVWSGDVGDVGCGTGFHLPRFAADAHSVLGVEPHPPLVEIARRRVVDLPHVRVEHGDAERLPLPDACVDVVHARTAYFFGPGCEPGIREAMRVLRPGGVLVVVDLDATAHDYGGWMRANEPGYDPAAVEAFFARLGFELRRVDTRWVFPDRETLRAVLGIEFTKSTAAWAYAATPGLALDVGYRIHTRRRPAAGLLVTRAWRPS